MGVADLYCFFNEKCHADSDDLRLNRRFSYQPDNLSRKSSIDLIEYRSNLRTGVPTSPYYRLDNLDVYEITFAILYNRIYHGDIFLFLKP